MAHKTKVTTNLQLPVSLHEQLRRAAYEQHLSQGAIIRAALTRWLAEHNPDSRAAA